MGGLFPTKITSDFAAIFYFTPFLMFLSCWLRSCHLSLDIER
jgi:hypothetical protein